MSDVINIEKTGVALFKESTGSETTPLFETNNSVYLNDNVDFPCTVNYGDDWVELSLSSGVTGSSTVGAKTNGIFVRNDGDHIFVSGCIAYTGTSATGNFALTVSDSMPESYRPSGIIFRWCPMNGTNFALLGVLPDGAIYLGRVYKCGATAAQTPTITYIDIAFDYFVSHV